MQRDQLFTADPDALLERIERLEMIAPVPEIETLLEESRSPAKRPPIPDFLKQAFESFNVVLPEEAARSHRPVVGPLLVGAKRGFRFLFQPFINEVLRAQVHFNERIVGSLLVMHEHLERQARLERRARLDLVRRLEELERRFEDTESED